MRCRTPWAEVAESASSKARCSAAHASACAVDAAIFTLRPGTVKAPTRATQYAVDYAPNRSIWRLPAQITPCICATPIGLCGSSAVQPGRGASLPPPRPPHACTYRARATRDKGCRLCGGGTYSSDEDKAIAAGAQYYTRCVDRSSWCLDRSTTGQRSFWAEKDVLGTRWRNRSSNFEERNSGPSSPSTIETTPAQAPSSVLPAPSAQPHPRLAYPAAPRVVIGTQPRPRRPTPILTRPYHFLATFITSAPP